jgi:hypothetical protein
MSDMETPSREAVVAVDDQVAFKAAHLLVGVDVIDAGKSFHALHKMGAQ